MLKTTPFNLLDGAFLNGDRPQDSWSVHVEVRVSGHIDEKRLVDAIRRTTQLHPIARARIKPYNETTVTNHWVIPDEVDRLPLDVVDSVTEADIAAIRSRLLSIQVPLSVSPAFMVTLVHHADGDWLMLNVNHTLGDGLATFRIMTSIINQYAGNADPVPDFDPLSVRDLRALAGAKSIAERLERAKVFLDFLWKAATPPVRVRTKNVSVKNPDDDPGYGFALLVFNADETKRFMARRVKPATVNDMLLAGLALTVKEWNKQNGGKRGRISVMMPVNMRAQEWWFEVVSNFSSYVSVSLTEDEQLDFSATTQSICQQTTKLKEAGAAGTLIDLLEVPRWLPAILKARLRDILPLASKNFFESSLLSNLGRLATAPDMGDAGKVNAVYFSPPAPMPMGVSVGAASMEDMMFLTLRYRYAQFDAVAAEEFAQIYKKILLG